MCRKTAFFSILVSLLVAPTLLAAENPARQDFERLRREVEELRGKLAQDRATVPGTEAATFAGQKLGPNRAVTTKTGKLEIGGLLQIWSHVIANDSQDVFGSDGPFEGSGGTGECIDNNTYRIRRAQLSFKMYLTERISAYIMIDPAREATSFPEAYTNQGLLKRRRENWRFPLDNVPSGSPARVQTGSGAAGRMLREAYLKFEKFVPHHDFTIGQFYVPLGEEGPRNSRYLDFPERAMVTRFARFADVGVQVHGWWWGDNAEDARVQYWLGGFNGAGTLEQQRSNRADDNDAKDFLVSALVRPLWGDKTFGSLELGYSRIEGVHGEGGDQSSDASAPRSGLNRRTTVANRQFAWALYKLGAETPLRGWWLRGEWGSIRDRFAPFEVGVFDLAGGDPLGIGDAVQEAPHTLTTQGWYLSTGYKLTDSFFAERLGKGGFWNKLLEPTEFTFRYERFGNIFTEDLAQPDTHTDIFDTSIWTFGVNYYIKAYNARVQVNYGIVNEPENKTNQAARGFREVSNNTLLFSYQIAW